MPRIRTIGAAAFTVATLLDSTSARPSNRVSAKIYV
jgi:hypothetical protein